MNFQQTVIDLTASSSRMPRCSTKPRLPLKPRPWRAVPIPVEVERFFVDEDCFPQTIDVVKTRAAYFGYFAGAAGDAGRSCPAGMLRRPPVPERYRRSNRPRAASSPASRLAAWPRRHRPDGAGTAGSRRAPWRRHCLSVPASASASRMASAACTPPSSLLREANVRLHAGRIIGVLAPAARPPTA